MKPMQEIKISIWNLTPNLHTNSHFRMSAEKYRQVVHPWPQTPQRESVAKPEHPLLIILSIACEYDVNGNLFSSLFKKQSSWTKTF